jgi:hypothetical protein
MRTETGWALKPIQDAFTWFILFQTWVQPLDGWLIDKLGPRWFISAAGILCGVGWAGMGMATSIGTLTLLYIVAGVGAAFTYSGSIGSALKWFRDRRGLASDPAADSAAHGALRAADSEDHRGPRLQDGVHLDGRPAGRGDIHRRAVPAASEASAGCAAVEDADSGRAAVHDGGDAADAAVLCAVRGIRDDGGVWPVRDREPGPLAKAWAAVLTLTATLSPLANGASRIFWGFASIIGRERAMVITFILQSPAGQRRDAGQRPARCSP